MIHRGRELARRTSTYRFASMLAWPESIRTYVDMLVGNTDKFDMGFVNMLSTNKLHVPIACIAVCNWYRPNADQ